MSEQGVFGLQVPPGGVLIPVNLDFPATVCVGSEDFNSALPPSLPNFHCLGYIDAARSFL